MKYKRFELPPMDGQKSYYRKAWITEYANGDKELTSYDTVVCKIDADGHFIRHWGGYSRTTQKHINSFLQFYGLDKLQGKTNWDKMPVASLRRPHSDMTWEDSYRAMMARRAAH